MKKVHLLCNAHLDPIWQWEWEEGASSALSTFQSAANLLKEYDYTFCHNEVNLYKYTEKYAPALFKEMQELVKEKKWHIMGGWYLQPDCLMPCGEGFVRQIQEGKIYFTEKFNTFPKTAINFDPFGHSRGLVQILKKCGQDNYVFMRPYGPYIREQLTLPEEAFNWIGYDGSSVKTYRIGAYNSTLGHALEKIKWEIGERSKKEDIMMIPWGVGNHGGGPSRKDLGDIKEYIKENEGKMEIIHSTPEDFFNEIEPKASYDKSLLSCMVGCYTSMAYMKQKYRELERQLSYVEKLATIASLKGVMSYPEQAFREVTEDMLNIQFHDILPGDMIRAGEDNGVTYALHGLQILNQVRASALFGMVKGQKVAEPGTYPIMVINPKTYEGVQYVTFEMSIVAPDGLQTDDLCLIDVFDEEGNKLPSQNIKEGSNIGFEWRKRVIFKANLKPLSVNRFTAKLRVVKKYKLPVNEDVVFENDVKKVVISSKSGLIESYKVNGKELAKGKLFEPYLYEDYEDPWGMNYTYVGWDEKPFVKMDKPHGVFDKLQSFEVIEDGDIYIGAEAFFECGDTKLRIGYKVYKEGDMVDVDVNVFPSESNKAVKLHMPLEGKNHIGEQVFGYEELFEDGNECVSHDFIALKQDDGSYVELIKPSNYGSSYKDDVLKLTLLRTVTYCAHPVPNFPLIKENIFIDKVDQAQRDFSFRLTTSKEEDLKNNAELFIEKPYALNIFPTIDEKEDNGTTIETTNPRINVVTIKKGVQKEGYIFRLQNCSSSTQDTEIRVNDVKATFHFNKFEVKTVIYNNNQFVECDEMVI